MAASKRRAPHAVGRTAHKRPNSKRRKPSVTIIGAGRLGTALALALCERGYTVEAVVARRITHARRAARLIPSGPRAITDRQLDLLPPSDLLFITTPDDAVERSARSVAAHASTVDHERTALHTSGALSSTVLSPLREAGFHTGSMHPLVSVSDAVAGASSLQKAFYCVEGDAAASRVARAVVRSLGGQSFSVHTRDKALYHAAAVMASGHATALFDLAIEMLTHCGLKPGRARAVLMPLLRSTIENLSTNDPAHALTGTFARADTATVHRHLAALRRLSLPDALAAYVLLGRRSIQLAKLKGADRKELERIALALKEGEA
jgi:predicted short-subunit dehydrogenase-like oxidoreductase (DUF2520 family)